MTVLNLKTIPTFSWDKMAHFPISGVFRNRAEFNKAVLNLADGISRPRGTGTVSIPGNAQIELLDTFNNQYVVTGIQHSVDSVTKRFGTQLTLELFIEYQSEGDFVQLGAPQLT